MIEFHALGGLTVTENGDEVSIGGPRQRRLVAMLLIHRNAVVSVDRLAEAVFAGEPTPAASTTLRSYVARIRKVVNGAADGPRVVTQPPGYALRLPGDEFDVASFERLLTEAGAQLGRGDAVGAASSAREALRLWRGDAYAEFADEEWARPEAQRLEELRLVAHERLMEAELACGRAAEVIPTIESLVADHPLREAFRAQLMIALYRTGRQADALRVLHDHRQVLLEELGLDPSPTLEELERRVLTHDPTLMLIEPAGQPLRGYRLGERLGTGRDGTVYAARLPRVERDLAVRVFREEIADAPGFVRSFETTVHRVVSLHHPAIVPIHDYWREPGAAYLVMRRMHGGTLAERLGRGSVSSTAVAALVNRIGGALVAMAEAGVAHGRVIPDSVFFDTAGDVFLADFALGPTDPTRSASDDVHDFAVMVRRCLAGGRGPVADVLARGVATAGRPAMGEFVAMLVAALTGTEAGLDRTRPNPYKGLRAFDEADAADFFGRTNLVEEILARLEGGDLRARLVLVVGGSGTGKSSLVRAGLLPRVRHGDVPGSQDWFITTMLPGSSPFKELAEGLRRVAVADTIGLADQLALDEGGIDRVLRALVPGDGQVLLVVDQFEELFTLASDQDRRAFLDGVIHAVEAPDSRLRVVATLRADFYDRPLAVQRFGAAVNDATVTIAAMSPADLEAAIAEPAERVGGWVERALVAELVSAVVDEPAALPSLQFTLYELAERNPDRALTLAAYWELGGVDGAIASRAEQLYASLDDTEGAAVRRMFERLVVVGAEGEPTRRRTARTDLSGRIADPSVDATVDRWAQARLLTLDRHPQSRVPTVELAHEALLREWPRLRDWIEEDRDAIVSLGHLRDAAAGWVELGRDPGALYRGARLEVALDVVHGHPHDLTEAEREFLDASRNERDRAQQEAAERVARQARANRRLRIQLAAIAVALVVALAGGLLALGQRQQAHDAADRAGVAAVQARDAETAQLAQRLGAQALVEEDLDLSLLLARQAVAIEDSPQTRGYLLAALQRSPRVIRMLHGGGDTLTGSAISPDGTTLAVLGAVNGVHFFDTATFEELGLPIDDGRDIADSLAYSPDGRVLAVGYDHSVRLFDARTRNELAAASVGGFAGRLAFTNDGSRLVVVVQPGDVNSLGGERARIAIRDAATLEPAGRAIEPAAYTSTYIGGVAASPHLALTTDDRFVLTAADDGELTWWDLASGEKARTLEIETGMHALALSPDGRTAAVGIDRGIQMVSLGDGTIRAATSGASGRPNWLLFSPDGETLAATNLDGTVTLWDVESASPREILRGHSNSVQQPVFRADGETLYTVGHDGRAIAWDVTGQSGLRRPFTFTHDRAFDIGTDGHPGEFSPDGELIAVGLKGEGVALVDGRELTPVGPPLSDTGGEVKALAFSPDGRTLASVTRDGALTLWDLGSRSRVHGPFESGAGGSGGGIGFSLDGATLTTAGEIGSLQRWDVETGANRGLIGDRVRAHDLALSADRSTMAFARPDQGGAEVRDVDTGASIATVPGSPGLDYHVALSPDGHTLAVGGFDEVVRIWDVSTEELLLKIEPGSSGARSLEFSPDGSMLAVGGFEPAATLWDVATGTQIGPRLSAGSRTTMLDISPDGRRLLITHGNGQGAVWDIDPESWARRACTLANRTLTPEEWDEFLPGLPYQPACAT